MPIAYNPDTQEGMFLDDGGAWQKAQTAVHPETKQTLIYDGKSWVDAMPKPPEPPLTAAQTAYDVGASGMAGLGKGTLGILGAPGDIGSAVGAGAEYLGMSPETRAKVSGTLKKTPVLSAFTGPTSAELQKQTEQYTGEFHKPKTALGRYAEFAGELAPTVVGGAETLPAKLLTRVAVPAIVGQTAEEVTGSPYAKAIAAVTGAIGAAGTSAALRGALRPQAQMSADFSRALLRDGDTEAALAQRLQVVKQERPNATIADVAGENVRGLVERLSTTPGAGRTIVNPAMTARQEQQAQRIAGDLTGLTGSRQTAYRGIKNTMEQRAQDAAPIYEEAFREGDHAIWSNELERLSSAPFVKAAMQRATNNWRNNAIADGYGAMNPGAMVEGGGQLKMLSGKVPVSPNTQFWDYTKRALDDMVRNTLPGTDKRRILTKLTKNLRDELDAHPLVPEQYKQAREMWGGHSQYIDAIKEGGGIASKDLTAEELRDTLAGMSEAQREAYRMGAVSSIVSEMRHNPAKAADMTRALRSPEMRDKIREIMPTPEAAASWEKRLNYEVRSSELTGKAMGNSRTALRQAEREDAQSLQGELIQTALTHGYKTAFLQGVMGLPKTVRDTLRSRSDKLLGEALTQPNRAIPRIDVHPKITLPIGAAAYGEPGSYQQRARGGRVWHPVQTGAKRAKDGNWYLKNPEGGYLRVEMTAWK